MALLFECTPQCARKLLDTADIVREAILRQQTQVTRDGKVSRRQNETSQGIECKEQSGAPLTPN